MRDHDDFEGSPAGWDSAPPPRTLTQILWQRKALVFLGAVVGLVAGFLFYVQRTPVFQSSAQVLVIKKRSDALPILGGDPRLSYVEDYMATHLVLLRSPLVVERAVKKRDLQNLKSFENVGNPAGVILGSLTVGRDIKETSGTSGTNNIINLSYRGPVAEECGKILTAIIESYQDFLDVTYRNVSEQTLELITKARDVLKRDLADSQKEYQKFRMHSPLVWRSKEGNSFHQERVAGIETKRSQLLIRQAELRDRVRALDKAIKEGKGREALAAAAQSSQAAKDSAIEHTMEGQLLPLLLREQQLMEEYGEDYPELRTVRKRITLTREFIKNSAAKWTAAMGEGGDPAQRYLNVLRQELQEANLSQQSLTQLLENMKSEARALSNYELEEERLRGDISRLQLLYEGTIKRLAEINLVRDAGGFDARTLSQPGIGSKVAPSALQTIAGGLLLGLLAGIGLAYLADFSDKSFRTPEEIRRRLGYPLVGHIPFLKPDPEAAQAAGALALDPLLCTFDRPRSIEAEAYRAVRTALFFSTLGEEHKVIQVTSPSKGDGKSILAANLAVSIAQSGKKVLLVDGDCRRPRLHKIFALEARQGLASVLVGAVAASEAVVPTMVPGLSLLPCGPVPPNPSELLTSSRFREMLDQCREQYDYVLVDTPPLLAVTDPCMVAGRVDGLFLTLRLARQGRPRAERAKQILASLGVRVLGVVVNGVSNQKGSGIYTAEHYDYSESYGDELPDEEESYYEHDEQPAVKKNAAPAAAESAETILAGTGASLPEARMGGSGRGFLKWFWSWMA